jgi:hypothetical protein
MAAAFPQQQAAVLFDQSNKLPPLHGSGESQLNFLGRRIICEGFFTTDLQQQFNGISQIPQAILPGFALTIGSWNLQTGGPVAAFLRLPAMQNGGVFMHDGRGTLAAGLVNARMMLRLARRFDIPKSRA